MCVCVCVCVCGFRQDLVAYLAATLLLTPATLRYLPLR